MRNSGLLFLVASLIFGAAWPTKGEARQADGTTWLGGQGNWDNGGDTTLQGIVNGINPTTGGWAPLPNTRLADVLLTQAQAQAISPYIWGNYGSTAHVDVWGGAAFNGKSFLLGSGGGHFSYFGNEIYRIRITDPPGAVRMYDPPAPSHLEDPSVYPSTFVANPWGPVGSHRYDQWRWDPAHPNEYWMSGANCNSWNGSWDGRLWKFDVDASTPKSAWSPISLTQTYGKYARDAASIFVGPDGSMRYHQGGHPSDWWDQTIDRVTMTLSPSTGFPSPSWGQAWYDQPRIHRLDSATYFAPSRYPVNASYGTSQMQLMKKAGNDTPVPVWAPMPAWFNGSADFDGQGGMANDGRRIVIWGSQGDVACFDTVTNSAQAYVPSGTVPTRQPGNYNGVYGRWAYVPEAKAFVGISRSEENVWVFRPPSAWNIGAGSVAPTITTQPEDQSVTAGQTATFSVTAAGTATLSYQWQRNGVDLAGATSSSYTTPTTTSADSGATFRVIVTNSIGSATSSSVTLTVTSAVGGGGGGSGGGGGRKLCGATGMECALLLGFLSVRRHRRR